MAHDPDAGCAYLLIAALAIVAIVAIVFLILLLDLHSSTIRLP